MFFCFYIRIQTANHNIIVCSQWRHSLNTFIDCAKFVSHILGCAVMTQKMNSNPSIWQKRPMSATMLQYAAEDVSQLLLLADKLACDLGGAELRILPKLSTAYAQWHWDAADRDGAQPNSYRHAIAREMICLECIVHLALCCTIITSNIGLLHIVSYDDNSIGCGPHLSGCAKHLKSFCSRLELGVMFTCDLLQHLCKTPRTTRKISDSNPACSARASLPLNVDLEMTFPIENGVQSYRPKFELPSEDQAEKPADQQAAAGGFAVYLRCSRP